MKFRLTYELVTEESAQHGEAERSGWLDSGGYEVEFPEEMTLRDAVETFHRESADSVTVEPDSVPMRHSPPRWITAVPTSLDEYGESRSVSLHIPNGVSGASRIRIARLLGVPSRWQ